MIKKAILLDISRYRVLKPDRFKKQLFRLKSYGYNQVFLNIENGLALKSIHPIGSEMDSYSIEEMKDLVHYSNEIGIELIPSYQSCGHMFHTLKWDRYKDLAESDSLWSVAPDSKTLQFFEKIYMELSEIFTTPYIHVGGDEIYDFMEGRSKDRYKDKSKEEIYLKYLLSLKDTLSKLGKRMMIWGDIIQNSPDLIKSLPKDVVVLYWMYDFEKIPEVYSELECEFYICPGLQTWKSEFFRFDYMKRNLQMKFDELRGSKGIGFLLTDWGDGGHIHPPAITEFLAEFAIRFYDDKDKLDQKLETIISLFDSIHHPNFMDSSIVRGKSEFLSRMLFYEYPISGEGFHLQSELQLERFINLAKKLSTISFDPLSEEINNYLTLVIARTNVVVKKMEIQLKVRRGETVIDEDISQLINFGREAHILLTEEWLGSSKIKGLFYHNYFHTMFEEVISEDFQNYKEGKFEKKFIYDRDGFYNQFSVGNRDALHYLWSRFI